MLVLIDLEWDEVVKFKRNATQLSAIRVDENWTIVDHFSSIIVPPDKNKNINWSSVAYQGYQPEEFLAGEKEQDCYFRFKAWLNEDDLICCNGDQTEQTLHFLHNRHDKQNPYIDRCIYARPVLFQQSSVENADKGSIYELAEKEGISVQMPEHCSENDIKVLYELFVKLNISVWQLYHGQKGKAKEIIPFRLRNRAEIEACQYPFVYTKDSGVYHSNKCKLILSTKSLCGCYNLRTARKNRRPCLQCKPEGYAEWKKSETDRLRKEKTEAEFPHLWKYLHPRDDVASVTLIDGEKIFACWKRIVGYCNYSGHPGMLTMENVKGHDCFHKQCLHLSVNPLSDYWLNRDGRKTKQERKEEQLRLEKEMSAAKAEKEALLKNEFQKKADQSESNLLVIRVTVENRNTVRINYVSEYSFADGNLFPSFLEAIREDNPNLRVIMRHVRNINGQFVTTDEFLKRKL